MPVPSETAFSIRPYEHPEGSKCRNGFGVIVEGLRLSDIDSWTPSTWSRVKDLVFIHKVVIFKDQGELHPNDQLKLMLRYSGGAEPEGMHSKDPQKFALRKGASVNIPECPVTQVVGVGLLPAGHYGLPEVQVFQRTSKDNYKTPLTPEEEAAGIIRPVQIHFDAAFNELHPPQVGSLFCHKPPVGPDLTLRFDNENGGSCKIAPGATIYFEMSEAYKLLSDERRAMADHSRVEYAPRAFTWLAGTHFTEDGAGVYSEGLEVPLDELPPYDPETQVVTYPMVWINPLTGEKSLQVHTQTPIKLFLKSSADGEERIVTDLAEVRSIVRAMSLPWLKPDRLLAHKYEKGDALIWYNMGLQHSATEFPSSYGSRIMHQINVSHKHGPTKGTVADDP